MRNSILQLLGWRTGAGGRSSAEREASCNGWSGITLARTIVHRYGVQSARQSVFAATVQLFEADLRSVHHASCSSRHMSFTWSELCNCKYQPLIEPLSYAYRRKLTRLSVFICCRVVFLIAACHSSNDWSSTGWNFARSHTTITVCTTRKFAFRLNIKFSLFHLSPIIFVLRRRENPEREAVIQRNSRKYFEWLNSNQSSTNPCASPALFRIDENANADAKGDPHAVDEYVCDYLRTMSDAALLSRDPDNDSEAPPPRHSLLDFVTTAYMPTLHPTLCKAEPDRYASYIMLLL